MTLDNLLGMSLERVEPDPLMIKRLLEAAQRNIQDAELEAVSNENRFDAAYKAIEWRSAPPSIHSEEFSDCYPVPLIPAPVEFPHSHSAPVEFSPPGVWPRSYPWLPACKNRPVAPWFRQRDHR